MEPYWVGNQPRCRLLYHDWSGAICSQLVGLEWLEIESSPTSSLVCYWIPFSGLAPLPTPHAASRFLAVAPRINGAVLLWGCGRTDQDSLVVEKL